MSVIDKLAPPSKIHYKESRTYGSSFRSSTKFIFPEPGQSDSTERVLELRIATTELDEDSDPLEKLLIPLKVLLVERENGKAHIDVYHFTHDGDFVHHSYSEAGESTMTYDGDLTKLYRYGERIRDMLSETNFLDRTLETHPTVQRLKNHTLWKDPPKSPFYEFTKKEPPKN